MAKPKKIAGVECDSYATESIRLVLIARFEEMCALRGQALDWSDPEGVHDMRVASRRLRGALRDFMPHLRKPRLSVVMKQLKSLADALGDVRDQDVAISALEKLRAGAPPQAAALVDQLIQARDTLRKDARTNLRQALYKNRLRQFQTEFAAAVDAATANAKSGKRRTKRADVHPEITYHEVARRTIRERLKEVEKLSRGLYQPLKIKPLHRLRIAAKRFRYALELFEPCCGPSNAIFAKKVAALQSSLGELHDADSWIATFKKDLKSLAEQPKELRGGALWLLGHFVNLHSEHLRSALVNWSEWEAEECGPHLKTTLKKDSTPAVQSPEPVQPKRRKVATNALAT